MTRLKAVVLTLLVALVLFSGVGLLVYGGVTGVIWARSVGFPLLLVGVVSLAYGLSR